MSTQNYTKIENLKGCDKYCFVIPDDSFPLAFFPSHWKAKRWALDNGISGYICKVLGYLSLTTK